MPAINTAQALSNATEHLLTTLAQSSLKHYLEEPKVRQHVEQKVQEWAYQAKSNLDQQHPFIEAQQQLEQWLQKQQITSLEFGQLVEEYQQFTQQLGWPDERHFWQQQFSNTQLHVQFQLLREKWQRKLTEAVAAWEFEQLALQRDAFLDEMKEFLTALQRMAKHQENLGVETGIFIDYSSGKLSQQDIEKFQQWCSYLEQNKELLALAKKLGSAQPSHHPRRAAVSAVDTQAQSATHQVYEEIVGIQLARNLAQALPHELALLADPDLEVLFDLKYLEENLMSFHMQGQSQAKVLDQQRPHRQLGHKGPMVLCLDTSGSMHGQPELIAKAITLFLAMQAMNTHRAMYIINFSTQLTVMEIKKGQALDDVLHFLSQSFHGGTDLEPALNHALDRLENSSFQHADVIVISDFVMGHLNDELMQRLQAQQQQGHGFYAVAIGNFRFEHLNAGLFDHQWVYQAKTGQVVALKQQAKIH